MVASQPNRRRRKVTWALWGALTLVTAASLGRRMTSQTSDKGVFLPGKTTHGHYQIELSCQSCHKGQFTTGEDFQAACLECHGEELDAAQDSHPVSKFTDPRNAARVAQLDARLCVACHAEHQPQRTGSMGLSLPADYCYHCHEDIAEERASHQGLAFDSCASPGCHRFHDNRALYEDFLVRHADDGMLTVAPLRSRRDGSSSCPSPARASLDASTSEQACQECHARETSSFMRGRHGMRLGVGLSAMEVSQARLTMKEEPSHETVTCAACHSGQKPDRTRALEVETCLGCHADEHSLAYKQSRHFEFLRLEEEGRLAPGSGVSCATCHMPRAKDDSGEVWVTHNQNANLRPNEKMIRSVCMQCHGLAFSIDALADPRLVARNFQGLPQIHVPSVDFAVARQ